MAIQKYEPEEIYPTQIPRVSSSQMYEIIKREQDLRERNQAIAFMQLMKQQEPTAIGHYQPEKHIESPNPHWLITAQKYLNTATWFLVACFALMLLHLATYRSLHPENTTYQQTNEEI